MDYFPNLILDDNLCYLIYDTAWVFCFSSHARIVWEGLKYHSLPALLFLKGIRSRASISLLFSFLFFFFFDQGSVHRGSVRWDNCWQAFPYELHVSSFSSWVPMLCPYNTVTTIFACCPQANLMLEEGALPQDVDRVLEDFGMPLGPLKVSDLSGKPCIDLIWVHGENHDQPFCG